MERNIIPQKIFIVLTVIVDAFTVPSRPTIEQVAALFIPKSTAQILLK